MTEVFFNNYSTTLTAPIDDDDTTLAVGSLGSYTTGTMRLVAQETGEIFIVTATPGALQFTVTRGGESTTPTALPANAILRHELTAASFLAAITENLASAVDSNFRIIGSSDATKKLAFEVDGFTTATTRTMTPPDWNGTLVTAATAQTISDKTFTNVASITLAASGGIDWAAGNVAIGASVGANNITIGGSSTTVIVAGNLTVSGTTTTLNTTTLDVEDVNITVNAGGNDASSEGAGLTVDRTGTSGSLIYKDASATKFAIGALGAEVDIVGISSTQTLTNKTLTAPDINGGTVDAVTSLGVRSTGAAFDLQLVSTEVFTSNRALTITLNDAARTVSLAGNVTLAADFITSGANSLTFTTTGATSVTLPTTGTLATLAGAEAFTNKTGITLAASAPIDWAAGNVAVGASIGANTMTLGGSTSSVALEGFLKVGTGATASASTVAGLASSHTSGCFWHINSTDTGGRDYSIGSTGSASSAGVGKFAVRDLTGSAWRIVMDSSGNIGLGETAPDYKLDVNGSFGFTPGTSVTPVDNGDVVIEFTNNTTLTFRGKGSDGTVRSATLTLA